MGTEVETPTSGQGAALQVVQQGSASEAMVALDQRPRHLPICELSENLVDANVLRAYLCTKKTAKKDEGLNAIRTGLLRDVAFTGGATAAERHFKRRVQQVQATPVSTDVPPQKRCGALCSQLCPKRGLALQARIKEAFVKCVVDRSKTGQLASADLMLALCPSSDIAGEGTPVFVALAEGLRPNGPNQAHFSFVVYAPFCSEAGSSRLADPLLSMVDRSSGKYVC